MVSRSRFALSDEHILFVYGTLKREFSNHYFLRNSDFLGWAKTAQRYGLYVDEYPLVYEEDPVSPIIGEAYRIDGDTLKHIDGLEGHPDHYHREQVEIILDTGERCNAWIYFFPKREGRLIASGEFNLSTELGRD